MAVMPGDRGEQGSSLRLAPARHRAWAYVAAIYQMTRRLAAACDHNPNPGWSSQTGSIEACGPPGSRAARTISLVTGQNLPASMSASVTRRA